jgi:hypothetical protein
MPVLHYRVNDVRHFTVNNSFQYRKCAKVIKKVILRRNDAREYDESPLTCLQERLFQFIHFLQAVISTKEKSSLKR